MENNNFFIYKIDYYNQNTGIEISFDHRYLKESLK